MSGEMNMKVLLASYRTADKIRNTDKKIRNDTNMKMTLTKSNICTTFSDERRGDGVSIPLLLSNNRLQS